MNSIIEEIKRAKEPLKMYSFAKNMVVIYNDNGNKREKTYIKELSKETEEENALDRRLIIYDIVGVEEEGGGLIIEKIEISNSVINIIEPLNLHFKNKKNESKVRKYRIKRVF